MYILFMMFLNVIVVFVSGFHFAIDFMQKNLTENSWLNLFLCILNIIIFGFNIWRLKHDL